MCKFVKTTDRLISIFRNTGGIPLSTLRSTAGTLEYYSTSCNCCTRRHSAATITSKVGLDSFQNECIVAVLDYVIFGIPLIDQISLPPLSFKCYKIISDSIFSCGR